MRVHASKEDIISQDSPTIVLYKLVLEFAVESAALALHDLVYFLGTPRRVEHATVLVVVEDIRDLSLSYRKYVRGKIHLISISSRKHLEAV